MEYKEVPISSVTLDDTKYHDAILDAYDKAIAEKPDDAGAHYNKALVMLSNRRFAEGWREWEWRLQKIKPGEVSYKHFPVPRWDGTPLDGKHVLVWLEQGIGDQILAASMMPDLIRSAASVTVKCNQRLADLFRRSFPKACVLKYGEEFPERYRTFAFDCQMSVADLGAAFRNSFEDFPRRRRFLKAGCRLQYGDSKLKVGIAWHSRINHKVGVHKGMPLGEMLPLLHVPGVTFVSLQYGDVGAEIGEVNGFGANLIHDQTVDPLVDMDHFAAQVAGMDHVVTISNTTAHVAGALGIPTTLLLARSTGGIHSRHWYWFADIDYSPVYPSVSIIRQERPGEWWKPVRTAAQRIVELRDRKHETLGTAARECGTAGGAPAVPSVSRIGRFHDNSVFRAGRAA